jgi:chromosome segregation ATPase
MSAVNRMKIYATLVLGAALAAGCSSGGGGRTGESKKAIEGFQDTRNSITGAQKQVDATLASLNTMASGTDLQKTYKTFTGQVNKLEATAAGAKKRSDAMKKNLDAYVTKWQSEVGGMSDPSIRAGVTERQNAVKANFEKVRNSAADARGAYEPFMKTLQELEKALSIDLSPQAMPGLKPAIDNANKQGATLKDKLAAMQKELDAMLASSGVAGAQK